MAHLLQTRSVSLVCLTLAAVSLRWRKSIDRGDGAYLPFRPCHGGQFVCVAVKTLGRTTRAPALHSASPPSDATARERLFRFGS